MSPCNYLQGARFLKNILNMQDRTILPTHSSVVIQANNWDIPNFNLQDILACNYLVSIVNS